MSSFEHSGPRDGQPTLPPLLITILSNSPLFREGLAAVLCEHYPSATIESCSFDEAAPMSLFASHYRVILLDSGIGHDNTLNLIRRWRQTASETYVIVVELHDNVDLIVACIEAGANGYQLRGSSTLDLVRTISEVCQGQPSCSPRVMAEIFERLSRLSMNTDVNALPMERTFLTQRETEILEFIVHGYSNKAIAQKLVIEVRTVKHHVHNILRKLGVQHRWDAAHVAKRQGWFKLSQPLGQ